MKILFYDTKSYDRDSFQQVLKEYPDLVIEYTKSDLDPRTAALAAIATVDDDGFSRADAERLTGDLNFYGEPVVARITAVENVDGSPAAPAKSSRTDEDAPAC